MENSSRDGNTRPAYLPPEKSVCTSRSKLELDMEQWTVSKLGKEYVKAVYCYPAYLTYMQSAATAAKLLQSCLTLCDPIDGSPPGSSVPGSKFAGIVSAALSQNHLSGFEIAQLKFHHLH